VKGDIAAGEEEGIVLIEDNGAVHHFGGYRNVKDNDPLAIHPAEGADALFNAAVPEEP